MREQMGLYEIFPEKKVSYDEVLSAMVKSTKIPPEKIGSQNDFYESILIGDSLSFGINIEYYVGGYLSFIDLASIPELLMKEFYILCADLAFNLDTNIAVYSFTGDIGDILIFSPDRLYQEAIENGILQDEFHVQLYGDKKPLDMLIQ